MNASLKARSRAFTIFGFTQEPEPLLRYKLSERLGVVPLVVSFGNAGHLFFYTSYGDTVETEQTIVLKLGFARSQMKSVLSAQQLLDQKLATSDSIDCNALHGNFLVACFSKTEARFIAFKNLVSLPQLYYWSSGYEFIGSDNLRCLVSVLDRIELNHDIIPFHFVFRHAPGTMTYFQNVHRLFPGQLLRWKEGNLSVHCVQDLRFPGNELVFEHVDSRSVTALYQELKDVTGAYISDIEKSGHGFANALSGGVDSSILQLIINEYLAPTRGRTFSFVPTETPSFESEVRYARQASEIFETEHTFVKFAPEDYPALVSQAIEVLGQPVLSDVEPCKLAFAEFLQQYAQDLRFFFVAQGADTLFGLGMARKIKMLELVGRIPGSELALAGIGALLRPFTKKSQTVSKAAEILSHSDDPHLFVAPANTIAVYCDLDIVRRAFGDETLRRVLEYRRNWEIEYLNSANYTEKVHVVDLLSDTYEIQVQSSQLFLAYDKEQVYPFMDDDIVRMSFAFQPEIRYVKGLRVKPLLKEILEQRGLSTIARRPKGASVFTDDLYAWMRSGPLSEMIRDIDLPGFLSKADFEELVKEPDHFLWSLLTLDVFQKKVLKR